MLVEKRAAVDEAAVGTAAVTKAVVANAVVLLPAVCVTAIVPVGKEGVPLKVGLDKGALASKTPCKSVCELRLPDTAPHFTTFPPATLTVQAG